MVRVQITFSGNVQGVGFRWNVLQISKNYQVTGYVRNLTNGQVEILAEGAQQEVVNMLKNVESKLKDFWFSKAEEERTGEPHYDTFFIQDA